MEPSRRHENHHYVPEFLLRQWETGSDQKLTTYAWKHGSLRVDRHKAKSVCAVPGLYSFSALDRPRNAVESEILQPLDDQAARVHQALLDRPTVDLSAQDQQTWAHFVAALMIRTPWELDAMANGVPAMVDAWEREFDATPEELAENRKIVESKASARDFMLESWPGLWQGQVVDKLVDLDWVLVDLTKSSTDLLIGDQAAMRQGPLTGPITMYVPLSPTKLLVVADHATAAKLPEARPRDVAREVNKWTAAFARQYVYGTSDSHHRFLTKRFSPDRVIPPTVYA